MTDLQTKLTQNLEEIIRLHRNFKKDSLHRKTKDKIFEKSNSLENLWQNSLGIYKQSESVGDIERSLLDKIFDTYLQYTQSLEIYLTKDTHHTSNSLTVHKEKKHNSANDILGIVISEELIENEKFKNEIFHLKTRLKERDQNTKILISYLRDDLEQLLERKVALRENADLPLEELELLIEEFRKEYGEQIEKYKHQSKVREEAIKHREEESTNLELRIESLEKVLEEAQIKVNKCKIKNQKLESQIDDENKEKSELKELLQHSKLEIQNLISRIERLKEEKITLIQKIESVDYNEQSLERELLTLRTFGKISINTNCANTQTIEALEMAYKQVAKAIGQLIPTFTGKTHDKIESEIQSFINCSEIVLESLTEEEKPLFFRILKSRFREDAFDLIQAKNINSLADLKKWLKEAYVPKKTLQDYMEELKRCAQRPGENLMEYSNRIMKLMQDCKREAGITYQNNNGALLQNIEAEAMYAYKKGFVNKTLRYHLSFISGKSETLTDLITRAKTLEREMTINLTDLFEDLSVNHLTPKYDDNIRIRDFNRHRAIVCGNCGRAGHVRGQCRSRPNERYCIKCHHYGHTQYYCNNVDLFKGQNNQVRRFEYSRPSATTRQQYHNQERTRHAYNPNHNNLVGERDRNLENSYHRKFDNHHTDRRNDDRNTRDSGFAQQKYFQNSRDVSGKYGPVKSSNNLQEGRDQICMYDLPHQEPELESHGTNYSNAQNDAQQHPENSAGGSTNRLEPQPGPSMIFMNASTQKRHQIPDQ